MDPGETGSRQFNGNLVGPVTGESVGRMAVATRLDQTFGQQHPAARPEHPVGFGDPGGTVGPAVERAECPHNGRALVWPGQGLGRSFEENDLPASSEPVEPLTEPEHVTPLSPGRPRSAVLNGSQSLDLFLGTRATAEMAGAIVSQRPMVTTIDVTYPNGRIPTSVYTIPAKIINTHALTKNMGPAATTLKKSVNANTSWSAAYGGQASGH